MKLYTPKRRTSTKLTKRRGRPAVAVAVAAAAAVFAVQIATAQGPARAAGVVATQMVTHTVNVGGTPAADVVSPAPPQMGGANKQDASRLVLPAGMARQPGAISGLTIVPVFDSTITSDPNAAAIENTINAAIVNVESMFSDPITVTINFAEMTTGLGQSSTFYATVSYSQFLAQLKADAKTADDATAISLLPSVSTDPVIGSSNINVKTANLRAVGIATNLGGQPDGFIKVNTLLTSPGSAGSSSQYSLFAVVQHEIDEVLGLGSALPNFSSGPIFPQDLYRYSSANTRTYTLTDSRTSGVYAFFSINGQSALGEFDQQNDGGDFADWQSNPRRAGVAPKVQDAFATPGTSPALSVELTALDVIGYDRVGTSTPPAITTQPVGQTVLNGRTAQFTVAASGTPSPTYQWQLSTDGGATWSNLSNNSPYAGVTSTTLTIASVSSGLSGFRYRAVATNVAGIATSNAAVLTVRAATTSGDFDGDGKADIGVFRPSNGTWYVEQSGGGIVATQFGNGADIPVPGDYDGDGKIDVAVFRPSNGTWYVALSGGGFLVSQWGNGADIPVPGDYDGDGKTDVAIFRPSNGTWYVALSGGGFLVTQWGNGADIPVPGDYNGDGKTDVAIFRPSNGTWYVTLSGGGFLVTQWGNGADIPVARDYDGDGKTDIGIFRPSNGTWYVTLSGGGFLVTQWGNGSDIPVPGDYNGDGKADVAVFRPSNGTWYYLPSGGGAYVAVQWGNGADIPLLKHP